MIHHFRRRQSDGRRVSTQKLGKVKDFKSELKLSFFSALFITFSITFFVYNTSVSNIDRTLFIAGLLRLRSIFLYVNTVVLLQMQHT